MQSELNERDLEEYNKIDKTMTGIMLRAEKKLPKRGTRLWTSELGRLIHQARYYQLLLRRAKGLAYHENVLKKTREKANITEEELHIQDIQQKLNNT